MDFSNEQKLIVAMLADIGTALKAKGDIDPKFIGAALWSGNEWAIPMEYSMLFEQSALPPKVKHVFDVLTMWSYIEPSYKSLTEMEKERFSTEAYSYGEPKWSGFDGNEEGPYYSASSFIIEEMRRFSNFADGRELNSHAPTVERDEAMLEVFMPLKRELGMHHNRLSVDNLIEMFLAAYPKRVTK